MHCMKCGVKIEDQQVFCAECLTDMQNYPVDPRATAHIPSRPATPPAKKKSRRNRDAKPEEQIRILRLTVRCLIAVTAVTLAAFILAAAMLLHMADEQSKPNIGQNYGTITQTE